MSADRIKAVFLDRDGTINIEKYYTHKVEDFELLPGAIEAMRLLNSNGIKIYIVTNQAGIAKGIFTKEQYGIFSDHMMNVFKGHGVRVEEALYCPHHPDGIIPEYSIECSCRKPDTGMLEEVMKRESLKAEETALIGDKNSDIDAGERLGMDTYLVLTGYGCEHRKTTKAKYIEEDLLGAVKHILRRDC